MNSRRGEDTTSGSSLMMEEEKLEDLGFTRAVSIIQLQETYIHMSTCICPLHRHAMITGHPLSNSPVWDLIPAPNNGVGRSIRFESVTLWHMTLCSLAGFGKCLQ